MKAKITPFDIVKIKKTREGYIVVPRWDFAGLYLKVRKVKRK